MDDEELSALIRRRATRHRGSEQLHANVRTQVMLADAARAVPAAVTPAAPRGWRMGGWRIGGWRVGGWRVSAWRATGWRGAAAGFACGVLVTWVAGPLWQDLGVRTSIEAELVADHVRALQRGPLAEVASSDRHTVKPWFQGKLDYAPPVFDLGADDFPLIGGRVEKVHGAATAALAYSHNRHVLNVFVWPTEGHLAPQHLVRNGFNVVHWADASMQYWVVSDVERAELDRFVQLWLQHAAAQ